MTENFETSFFNALVEDKAIAKDEVKKLKSAIKRQNPNFVDDVKSHNFKGHPEEELPKLAKQYAKSFARELTKSNRGQFAFSDRLLKTDLKPHVEPPTLEKQIVKEQHTPKQTHQVPKTEKPELEPINPKPYAARIPRSEPRVAPKPKRNDDFEF